MNEEKELWKDEFLFAAPFSNAQSVSGGSDFETNPTSGNISENDKIKYFKEASFLVYSVGLSPSGKLGAFASDEDNNVTVFNINSKENLYKLTKNKSTLTNILFINENEIFVTSDDKKINYYKLN